MENEFLVFSDILKAKLFIFSLIINQQIIHKWKESLHAALLWVPWLRQFWNFLCHVSGAKSEFWWKKFITIASANCFLYTFPQSIPNHIYSRSLTSYFPLDIHALISVAQCPNSGACSTVWEPMACGMKRNRSKRIT